MCICEPIIEGGIQYTEYWHFAATYFDDCIYTPKDCKETNLL